MFLIKTNIQTLSSLSLPTFIAMAYYMHVYTVFTKIENVNISYFCDIVEKYFVTILIFTILTVICIFCFLLLQSNLWMQCSVVEQNKFFYHTYVCNILFNNLALITGKRSKLISFYFRVLILTQVGKHWPHPRRSQLPELRNTEPTCTVSPHLHTSNQHQAIMTNCDNYRVYILSLLPCGQYLRCIKGVNAQV